MSSLAQTNYHPASGVWSTSTKRIDECTQVRSFVQLLRHMAKTTLGFVHFISTVPVEIDSPYEFLYADARVV